MTSIYEIAIHGKKMSETRQVSLGDFLSEADIKKVFELKKAHAICEQVILPNLEEINDKLGQKNSPLYLAYACEYLVSQALKEKGDEKT